MLNTGYSYYYIVTSPQKALSAFLFIVLNNIALGPGYNSPGNNLFAIISQFAIQANKIAMQIYAKLCSNFTENPWVLSLLFMITNL